MFKDFRYLWLLLAFSCLFLYACENIGAPTNNDSNNNNDDNDDNEETNLNNDDEENNNLTNTEELADDEEENIADTAAIYFVTLSDYGDGSDEQIEVANAIKQYCSVEKCDFMVTLGDNFQNDGVTNTSDPQWTDIYKDVYGDLNLKFYVSIGNHDMNGNINAMIDYSSIDPLWYLPSQYYKFSKPDTSPFADFFVINTGDWDYEAEEETWLDGALQGSNTTWKFLITHAPIISNGLGHGDMAEDFGDEDIAASLVEDICSHVDLVLSGHDHIFSYLLGEEFGCNIKQLVIGTGGSDIYDFNASDTRAQASASMNGFGWFKVEKDKLTFRFIDTSANVYYQTIWNR